MSTSDSSAGIRATAAASRTVNSPGWSMRSRRTPFACSAMDVMMRERSHWAMRTSWISMATSSSRGSRALREPGSSRPEIILERLDIVRGRRTIAVQEQKGSSEGGAAEEAAAAAPPPLLLPDRLPPPPLLLLLPLPPPAPVKRVSLSTRVSTLAHAIACVCLHASASCALSQLSSRPRTTSTASLIGSRSSGGAAGAPTASTCIPPAILEVVGRPARPVCELTRQPLPCSLFLRLYDGCELLPVCSSDVS
jgi:hypothetical protein